MPFVRRGFAGEVCEMPTIAYDPREQGVEADPFYVKAYIYPVLAADGQLREVVLMHQDVTGRERAEMALREANEALTKLNAEIELEVAERTRELTAQKEREIEVLQQADRTKDEFLSVISHELRTPLNFITGFASTLADEVQGQLNSAQREAVHKILNGSERMLLLVDDLLDYAKIQSGRFELGPQPTSYGPLVSEAVALMRALADPKGITLETDVRVDGKPNFDGARVIQVLTNLLSNAVKFTEAGGTVSVRAYRRDDVVVTEVRDNGLGIAAEDMPKLFTRFQQLDMGNSRRAGGTGLGLAICKALVEAHGGGIGVESTPGAGSTFWFTLPGV
jgi:signal transduction histidine kinase